MENTSDGDATSTNAHRCCRRYWSGSHPCSQETVRRCTNPPAGRSRETKGAELTSKKKRVGRAVVLASIERVVYLPLVSFGPLAHHFDASDFFFTPSFRLAVETLSVQVCVEFKSWPAPLNSPPQTNPLLKVVGHTGPDSLKPRLDQPSHPESP